MNGLLESGPNELWTSIASTFEKSVSASEYVQAQPRQPAGSSLKVAGWLIWVQPPPACAFANSVFGGTGPRSSTSAESGIGELSALGP